MKTKFRFFAFLIIFILSFNAVSFAQTTDKIELNAPSAILVEATTGEILFEKGASQMMYPASMTKLLTAIILLEYFNPNDVIVIGREINEISWDSSKAGHKIDESITVENLIRGLMIPSGNDTAVAVARAVARKINDDATMSFAESEKFFSALMNEKAVEIGCTDSSFTNPHGYHDDNHYTTARDMAKIATYALKFDIISKICSEKSYLGNSMEDNDTTGLITNDYNWVSHNALITPGDYFYEYATGLKTGFTSQAGDCIAASAENENLQLISIVFQSQVPNRWIDAVTLFEYGFNNYQFTDLGKQDDIVGDIPLHNHKKEHGNTLSLIIKEDIALLLNNSILENIKTEINITNEDYIVRDFNKEKNIEEIKINAPILSDVELGTIVYKNGTEILAEVLIYSGRSVEEASFFEKIMYSLNDISKQLFTVIGLIVLAVSIIVIVVSIILIKYYRNRGYRNKYKFKKPRKR